MSFLNKQSITENSNTFDSVNASLTSAGRYTFNTFNTYPYNKVFFFFSSGSSYNSSLSDKYQQEAYEPVQQASSDNLFNNFLQNLNHEENHYTELTPQPIVSNSHPLQVFTNLYSVIHFKLVLHFYHNSTQYRILLFSSLNFKAI